MGSKTGKFKRTAGGALVRSVPRDLWRGETTPCQTKAPSPKSRLREPKRPGIERTDDVAFYWAYGSNLNLRQMARRCPRAKSAGTFYVTGAKLVFRGVADVVMEEGALCPGGLWKITAECERALDQYEGVGSGLYVKKYFKVRRNKHVYKCLFYQMRNERGVVPPGQLYLDSIVQGYRDFGLDVDYLDVAVQEAWGNKEMTPAIKARQIRRGETNMVKDMWTGEVA